MTEENSQQSDVQIVKNREIQYSPLRLIGILTVISFCTILLIVATFTRIKLFNCLQPIVAMLHPDFFQNFQAVFSFKPYFYIPQIPIILFTASMLGGACAMTSVFFYIIIGLTFLPVFGLGGGIDYIFQPTFGYILAFIPAALIAGKYVEKEYNILKLFKATFIAVLIIHILGFFYMLLVAVILHDKLNYIVDWLLFESFTRAVFDLFFGSIFMLLGKYCRKIIWILTSV